MCNFQGVKGHLACFDAFFCIGVTSSRVNEKAYLHLTYDLTLAVANALAPHNPAMVFVYVSGGGADSSSTMWQRVRGNTENALLKLPFRGVYIFRPGMIHSLDGIKSKTAAYRLFYSLIMPILPILRYAMPNHVLTTRHRGQAMLKVVRCGANKRVLESAAKFVFHGVTPSGGGVTVMQSRFSPFSPNGKKFSPKNSEISRKPVIAGAAGGDRTHDPWLRRPILYPLSYSRMTASRQRCRSEAEGYSFSSRPSMKMRRTPGISRYKTLLMSL